MAADPQRVSVLMVTENNEETVAGAIASVMGQTYKNYELLIIDNGSVDASAHIAAHMCGSHPAATLSLRPRRLVSAQYNALMQRSRGGYFAFIVASDVWVADKLERQVAFLRQQEHLGAVFSWVDYTNRQGQVITGGQPRYNLTCPSETLADALFFNHDGVALSSLLLRRSLVEKVGFFDPKLRHAYIYDFLLRLLVGGRVHLLPQRLARLNVFFQADDGDDQKKMASEAWQVLGKQAPKMLTRYPHLTSMFEALYDNLTRYAYEGLNFSAAEKYLRAKRAKFGLTEHDLLLLVDCFVHQTNFKEANSLLEQAFPQRASFAPQTQALLLELIARVVGFGDRSLDTFAAAEGLGAPSGKFQANTLMPLEVPAEAEI